MTRSKRLQKPKVRTLIELLTNTYLKRDGPK